MCEGFGVIVTKDGRYLFIEPDSDGNVSHSDILRRAGIKDVTTSENMFTRPFVRVEIPTWKIGSFRFDEQNTLPGWVDEDAVKTYCNKLLKRAAAAWDEYEKVKAAALDEYKKVTAPAWDEYKKVKDAARAEYEKVRDAARAEMIEKLSSIEGYVKA